MLEFVSHFVTTQNDADRTSSASRSFGVAASSPAANSISIRINIRTVWTLNAHCRERGPPFCFVRRKRRCLRAAWA